MHWFFAFFFISGFCSILYELVWLRLSMASFGVTTPLVSVVLSTFMAGLGFGSWASGKLARSYADRLAVSALKIYAVTEMLIGISAILVPYELAAGRSALRQLPLSSSFSYYAASGAWIGLTLLPWCSCIGATIPIAMLAIRNGFANSDRRSFSYLYLANVLGAVVGATLPLAFIELLGFHGTLKVGFCLNVLLAISAFLWSTRMKGARRDFRAEETVSESAEPNRFLLVLLFATGCTSMGIEVVWIRQFTPYIGTVVYAFATILGLYLVFTFIGSQIYRQWSRRVTLAPEILWLLLGALVLLPAITASPNFHAGRVWRLVIGIGPFSALLGFATPMLVDRWSEGDPDRAGTAYSINVLGCIAGPLLAGFAFLPLMSERWVLFVFAAPWFLIGVLPTRSLKSISAPSTMWTKIISYAVVLVVIGVALGSNDYPAQFANRVVLRDDTATIIATELSGEKRLLVNGVGITSLTPITKTMAHLPLASLNHSPESALVICFGMGTTFRSLLSWNISATAVELVPSVPKLFWYYHPDGPQLLQSPLAHVVIDDGRRYLERTTAKYDVITIDPPPPVEAAGSSLLYSKDFYSIIRQRLRAGGILQQWLPYGDPVVQSSVAKALEESFPYVRGFKSVEGTGFHFLASLDPIPRLSAAELVHRMPESAQRDLVEWGPESTAEENLALMLNSEFSPDTLIAQAPKAPALQDDHPTNEYYALRRRFRLNW